MTSLPKTITKAVLNKIGLLTPVQRVWRRRLQSVERRKLAALYGQFLRPGDLCFDIGANIGDVSAVMLELGTRVIAIEPQTENVQVLVQRFQGNHDVIIVPKAAGAQLGVGELMICSSSDCSSMSPEFVATISKSGRLPADTYKWTEVQKVETTTLDELISSYGMPNFVKIDVEGFEMEVLKGCRQKLKMLSLEFTPERLEPTSACIRMLENLGSVRFNYTLGRGRVFEARTWLTGDEISKELQNAARLPVIVGPGGDLYARFI